MRSPSIGSDGRGVQAASQWKIKGGVCVGTFSSGARRRRSKSTDTARARAVSVDFEQLLRAPELNVPTHTPPLIFHCDAAWSPLPSEPIEGDRVLFCRPLVV